MVPPEGDKKYAMSQDLRLMAENLVTERFQVVEWWGNHVESAKCRPYSQKATLPVSEYSQNETPQL